MVCAGSANKMTFFQRARTVAAFFFVTVLSLAAAAQTPAPNTTEWESEALKLRLFYPSDLVKIDVTQIAHIPPVGIFSVSDPKLAYATRCLRPVLVLGVPQSGAPAMPAVSASILLAELDVDCLTPEQQNKATNLLAEMAEIVNKAPGMESIVQPATYTIGWQKVHMAASQLGTTPSALFTMGISTNWNSHLLVWYFGSNSIDTLNRITKTTVRFGRDQAAPLYPLTIGNATP
jgi:hypothetical protein